MVTDPDGQDGTVGTASHPSLAYRVWILLES